jgi:hypothetical protein
VLGGDPGGTGQRGRGDVEVGQRGAGHDHERLAQHSRVVAAFG